MFFLVVGVSCGFIDLGEAGGVPGAGLVIEPHSSQGRVNLWQCFLWALVQDARFKANPWRVFFRCFCGLCGEVVRFGGNGIEFTQAFPS